MADVYVLGLLMWPTFGLKWYNNNRICRFEDESWFEPSGELSSLIVVDLVEGINLEDFRSTVETKPSQQTRLLNILHLSSIYRRTVFSSWISHFDVFGDVRIRRLFCELPGGMITITVIDSCRKEWWFAVTFTFQLLTHYQKLVRRTRMVLGQWLLIYILKDELPFQKCSLLVRLAVVLILKLAGRNATQRLFGMPWGISDLLLTLHQQCFDPFQAVVIPTLMMRYLIRIFKEAVGIYLARKCMSPFSIMLNYLCILFVTRTDFNI